MHQVGSKERINPFSARVTRSVGKFFLQNLVYSHRGLLRFGDTSVHSLQLSKQRGRQGVKQNVIEDTSKWAGEKHRLQQIERWGVVWTGRLLSAYQGMLTVTYVDILSGRTSLPLHLGMPMIKLFHNISPPLASLYPPSL